MYMDVIIYSDDNTCIDIDAAVYDNYTLYVKMWLLYCLHSFLVLQSAAVC